MNKLTAIQMSKQFRKDADELLQRMKEHSKVLKTASSGSFTGPTCLDLGEVIAQHTISMRDLESCIMRQGMALKYIGNPDPYPESRDPSSPVIAPTADGLKL